MEKFDIHEYSDIIDLPHHVSPNRRRMSNIERGAQFSPFAALTGYEAAVSEAGRITDEKRELSDDMKTVIDIRLQFICEHISDTPYVSITYFLPDKRKEGGEYVSVKGFVKQVDGYERCIVLSDGKKIPIESVREIDGDIFNNFV